MYFNVTAPKWNFDIFLEIFTIDLLCTWLKIIVYSCDSKIMYLLNIYNTILENFSSLIMILFRKILLLWEFRAPGSYHIIFSYEFSPSPVAGISQGFLGTKRMLFRLNWLKIIRLNTHIGRYTIRVLFHN